MKWRRKRLSRDPSTLAALDDRHHAAVVRRRVAAARFVGEASPAAARVASAPPGYLLAHDASDIARHAALLATLPSPGEVRLVVTPAAARAHWSLDVASRDRPGLLAAFTGVFADATIDVTQGVVATWDDGAALQAFTITATQPPDPNALHNALERSLSTPRSSPPIADADVIFRDGTSLYSCCDVVAADRPGLLHAVAVSIAEAGAVVHAARVTTTAGQARDRFDITDGAGRKLGTPQQRAIRAHVVGGVPGIPGRRHVPPRRWPDRVGG